MRHGRTLFRILYDARRPLMLFVLALSTRLPQPSNCPAADAVTERPYGIQQRVPWTRSRIKGSPDPPAPYRTQLAFPRLQFDEPLTLVSAAGTDRLFVSERYGKVYSFPNNPQADASELLLDVGKEVFGLAFHPRFDENGYFYVAYILHADEKRDTSEASRLSRFQVQPEDAWRAERRSEKVLLTWPSGGHNGGCIVFGPDGYLYLATGDGSGIADELETGQDLSDVRGAILRIDVDHPSERKPYGIPQDNPFVATAGARPEIWAYGLRQVWRMSFDRLTGDFWGGNVGQDLWEQIYRFEPGGNYGWSVTEGGHPFRPERKRGPTPILPPIVEHDHAVFRSITGGYVYRGSTLKELIGAYIYGDYDTGKIWMLRHDGHEVTEHKELFDSSLRIVAFGEDRAGEIYVLDHMGGRIHQLTPSSSPETASAFPRTLSETGLFTSVPDHTPDPGLIPYSVIAPAWSDNAYKERFLAIPGDSKIEFEAIDYPQPAPGSLPGWKFPDGTVLLETIYLEMETDNPASRRRLETRILHHERLAGGEDVGDQYWQGYSYIWNDEQSEAILLDQPQGLDRTFTIRDPRAPGGQRRQTWHFPSRAECGVCHNMAAKYALGVNTLQMNQEHDYGGTVDNQLRTLEHLGLFTQPLPAPPDELARLVDYRDASHELALRARSYLHANCSHCHRKWGGGNAKFQLLYSLKASEMGVMGTRPGQGSFYLADGQVVAPGDPYRSILWYRMSKLGAGRMPRIGSNLVDETSLQLMHDWIEQLPRNAHRQEDDQPVDRLRAEQSASLDRLRNHADLTVEDRARHVDRLLASTSGALRLLRAVDEKSLAQAMPTEIIARAVQSPHAHVRDLFERFLPEQQRTKRLGSIIDPNEILALPGDGARGKDLFFQEAAVQCKICHRIDGVGGEVGPDLSEIGKKYTRAQLLETILQPSKQIEPKYMAYTAETAQGQIYSGIVVSRSSEKVVLRDAQNKLIELATDDVERLAPQQKSLMPELLLRDMTASQVADLTTYLSALK